MCPSTGEECTSPIFCVTRENPLENDAYRQDVIGDMVIGKLDCEVANAVVGEQCAEVMLQRLARLALEGTGNTQRQAESLFETIGCARHGEYI
jgi:hypothetical protein